MHQHKFICFRRKFRKLNFFENGYKNDKLILTDRTSPTRHQLVSGIGIPLNLEYEAITLGLVLKAQYFLPETVNQLKWIYFPDVFGEFFILLEQFNRKLS